MNGRNTLLIGDIHNAQRRRSSHMESGTTVAVCMCGRLLFLFCFESASENLVCRAIAPEEVRHYSKVCRGSERMYSVCACRIKFYKTFATVYLKEKYSEYFKSSSKFN